jgi:hypothetical protein
MLLGQSIKSGDACVNIQASHSEVHVHTNSDTKWKTIRFLGNEISSVARLVSTLISENVDTRIAVCGVLRIF